jgi:adenylate cyclase
MKETHLILPRGSAVKKQELKLVLVIAISWTMVDFVLFFLRYATGVFPLKYTSSDPTNVKTILLRELNVFVLSLIIGYFLVTLLRNFLHNTSLWFNLLVKTIILLLVAIIMSFFVYFTYAILIAHESIPAITHKFLNNTFRKEWFVQKMPEWIFLFLLTLLAIEVNEKYSRGVFVAIILGKYLQPRDEERIIVFIDLKNSTPIAEKLGAHEYFQFISDVIFCISAGIMEHDGRIYQYVGDEVVVWWPHSAINAKKAILSLIESRKVINKNSEIFKRKHNIVPEFKAGIHTGIVTVGQVGIAKKELVMSGDTINTAARIRSACSELNQKFLASKEVVELAAMKDFQVENLGMVDLKGKINSIELFVLKI